MPKYVEKQNSDSKVFCRINRAKKTGFYLILPKSSQNKFCERILLDGFDTLPSGFYTNDGIGLTGGGILIFAEIAKKFGKKIKLTISKTRKSRLDSRGRISKITISHPALVDLNATVRATKRIRNEENRATVRKFLSAEFRRQFKEFKGTKTEYSPGSLSQILKRPSVTARLSAEDREILESFIPDYLSAVQGTLRAKSKLKVVFDSLDAGKRVFLEKVVREFRRKLFRKIQSEGLWQAFLRENILLLRNNYGQVIEKESVSLQGKFPDFMLIDPYSYLDVYEIKKPDTTLLKLDKSRNNYYWDVEISKAISQVENYLHQLQRNSDNFIVDLKKSESIDVSIVRPRGYIIAGTRAQLKGTKMIDDFRILSESLKNIDILLYDDLLSNLETFVHRLQQDTE